MNRFIKGIFYELVGRIEKMEEALRGPDISEDIDVAFLKETFAQLDSLKQEILSVDVSGDLDISELTSNNIIRYNTFYEEFLNIELFRYLIIISYGAAEVYFKQQITRIYDEIGCLQKPPLITTISNSENYYWALPIYDVIAVPTGEEKNLLNLPDLYHEIGHLIEKQYATFLQGDIHKTIADYFHSEIKRTKFEERPKSLIPFLEEKQLHWSGSWVMEFTCDLIATYLVGSAYAWTNLKLTTISSGQNRIYKDSPTHPSDEARMRAVFCMLTRMGETVELPELNNFWKHFLDSTKNAIPDHYHYIFPQAILVKLADSVFDGCINIGLRSYKEQIQRFGSPVTKLLNDAWKEVLHSPGNFRKWEMKLIGSIR
jgi:hypothetical protein